MGAIPSWKPIIVEWFIPKFRFQAINGLSGRGVWTQHVKHQDGYHVTPLDMGIFLRITNNDEVRARGISGYEFEVKSKSGWKRLERVELVPRLEMLELRTRPNDNEPATVDFRLNNIDARMREGPIDVGRWIEGYAFFVGEGEAEYLSSLKRIRITIYDTLGQKSVLEGPVPSGNDPRISMGMSRLSIIGREQWTPPWRGGTKPPPPPDAAVNSAR